MCIHKPIYLTGLACHAMVLLKRAGLDCAGLEQLVGAALGALIAEDDEAFDAYGSAEKAMAQYVRDWALDDATAGKG